MPNTLKYVFLKKAEAEEEFGLSLGYSGRMTFKWEGESDVYVYFTAEEMKQIAAWANDYM